MVLCNCPGARCPDDFQVGKLKHRWRHMPKVTPLGSGRAGTRHMMGSVLEMPSYRLSVLRSAIFALFCGLGKGSTERVSTCLRSHSLRAAGSGTQGPRLLSWACPSDPSPYGRQVSLTRQMQQWVARAVGSLLQPPQGRVCWRRPPGRPMVFVILLTKTDHRPF